VCVSEYTAERLQALKSTIEAAGGKARHHARRHSLRRKEVIAVEVELHAHGQKRGGSGRNGEDAARYKKASQRRSALIG